MNDLQRPTALGLPYHGVVAGTQLTLPNGKTLQNVLAGSGPSFELRAPGATGPNRSAEQESQDQAGGLEWRDYALLSGNGQYLGGHFLDGKVIYCDQSGNSWLCRVDFEINGGSVNVAVFLEKIFGRIGKTYPSINRQIASATFECRTSIPGYAPNALPYLIFHRSNNRSGSRWLYCGGLQGASAFNIIPTSFGSIFESVFEVSFSGSGSDNPVTLGDGVTASIDRSIINQSYQTINLPSSGTKIVSTPPPDPDSAFPPESITVSTESDQATGVAAIWQYELLREYAGDALRIVSGEAQTENSVYVTHDVSGSLQCGESISGTRDYVSKVAISVSLSCGAWAYSGSETTTTTYSSPISVSMICTGGNLTANYNLSTSLGEETVTTNAIMTGDFPSPTLQNGVLWISRATSQDWIATSQGFASQPVPGGPGDGYGLAINPVTGETVAGLDVQTMV